MAILARSFSIHLKLVVLDDQGKVVSVCARHRAQDFLGFEIQDSCVVSVVDGGSLDFHSKCFCFIGSGLLDDDSGTRPLWPMDADFLES